MSPDDKNSLNDNDNEMLKGFKLVFPLASLGNCCACVIAMSMPKTEANVSLMIQ